MSSERTLNWEWDRSFHQFHRQSRVIGHISFCLSFLIKKWKTTILPESILALTCRRGEVEKARSLYTMPAATKPSRQRQWSGQCPPSLPVQDLPVNGIIEYNATSQEPAPGKGKSQLCVCVSFVLFFVKFYRNSFSRAMNSAQQNFVLIDKWLAL